MHCIRLLALAFLLLLNLPLHAEPVKLLVLYPESSPAHERLYQTIIDGMRQHETADITGKQFSPEDDPAEIKAWIASQDGKALITLGKAGRQLGLKLELNIPLVSGAHILVTENQSSVSLAADPDQLFRKLKQMRPRVSRVFVVHSERNTGWLIRQADQKARSHRLRLEHVKIDSPSQVKAAFETILKKARRGEDAIWLPLDPAIPSKIIMPDLLRVAWQKELVIFGNNPIDVKKGILFAMYPDYARMGRQLAEVAIARIQDKSKRGPIATQYLNFAVNTRTASHLGISLDAEFIEQVNLVFPRR